MSTKKLPLKANKVSNLTGVGGGRGRGGSSGGGGGRKSSGGGGGGSRGASEAIGVSADTIGISADTIAITQAVSCVPGGQQGGGQPQ